MARYQVREGIRVVVDGTAYSNGATFTATEEQAAPLLRYGWVSPVAEAKPVKARARMKPT